MYIENHEGLPQRGGTCILSFSCLTSHHHTHLQIEEDFVQQELAAFPGHVVQRPLDVLVILAWLNRLGILPLQAVNGLPEGTQNTVTYCSYYVIWLLTVFTELQYMALDSISRSLITEQNTVTLMITSLWIWCYTWCYKYCTSLTPSIFNNQLCTLNTKQAIYG